MTPLVLTEFQYVAFRIDPSFLGSYLELAVFRRRRSRHTCDPCLDCGRVRSFQPSTFGQQAVTFKTNHNVVSTPLLLTHARAQRNSSALNGFNFARSG